MRLILHGDVSAALLAVTERSPVDLLWGIGGTPEGVITAAAIKCLGGQILGRLWPRNDEERAAARAAGYDLERVLDRDDLVEGDDVFFSATGITDGDVLQGVRFPSVGGASTESLVMRTRSGTVGGSARSTIGRNYEACAVGGLSPGRPPKGSIGAASRPTFETARSGMPSRLPRASERRNALVTRTWMRDWVTS